MKIIVNGRAGSGKDEFADYLVKKYGFTKIAFADGIYDIARKYFGMKYKDRYLLQQIGQKMREIKPNIWIDYTMSRLENIENVVISDLRQSNEYHIALEKGFLPVRIFADLETRVKRIKERDGLYPNLELLENESETGADKYSYLEIDNNGSIEVLHKKTDDIVKLNKNIIEDKTHKFKLDLLEKYISGGDNNEKNK